MPSAGNLSPVSQTQHAKPEIGGWDGVVGVLFGGLALILYIRTLAPGLLSGDSGEFQMAAWLGGIAHPTGYPLYLILGWLWTHLLPTGNPAYRMNLFSALWAAATVALLYVLLLMFGRRVGGRAAWNAPLAGLMTATFAVTPTFWSQATRAEVYTLNALFVVLLLLSCLMALPGSREEKAHWGLAPVALVFGLSLTHHRTMLLFLPALIVYLWTAAGTAWANRKGLATLALFILAPQVLYLYIPFRAPHTPYLHLSLSPGHDLTLYANRPADFLAMISGSVFRGALGTPAQGLGRLPVALGYLNRQFTPAGIAFGAMGLAALIRQRQWPLLALSGLGFVGIVAFGLVYFIGDIYDLFVPAYIVWALWMTVGLAVVLAKLSPLPRVVALLFACGIPVYLLVAGYARQDHSHDHRARNHWQTILAQPIPANTLLVSNDRNEIVPLWYTQYVEGQRPDLLGLFPLITPRPEHANVVRLLDSLIDTGRPVFLIKPMPGLEIKYRLAPAGQSLVHVVAPAGSEPLTSPADDAAINEQIVLRGWNHKPAEIRAGQTFTITLLWEPQAPLAKDYTSYVHLVAADGRTIAQSDHRPGGVYYPSSLWRPGERLWDSHRMKVLAQTLPGTYQIRAGFYFRPTMKRLGREIAVGTISLAGFTSARRGTAPPLDKFDGTQLLTELHRSKKTLSVFICGNLCPKS